MPDLTPTTKGNALLEVTAANSNWIDITWSTLSWVKTLYFSSPDGEIRVSTEPKSGEFLNTGPFQTVPQRELHGVQVRFDDPDLGQMTTLYVSAAVAGRVEIELSNLPPRGGS